MDDTAGTATPWTEARLRPPRSSGSDSGRGAVLRPQSRLRSVTIADQPGIA